MLYRRVIDNIEDAQLGPTATKHYECHKARVNLLLSQVLNVRAVAPPAIGT